MAHTEYHDTSSGSGNRGLGVGNNSGKVVADYYATGKSEFSLLESHYAVVLIAFCCAEPLETPPSPVVSIPFRRDPDFVDCGIILNQVHMRCATPGSRTALVGLGGVGYVKDLAFQRITRNSL